MQARAGKAQRRNYPHLPEDLWRRIALLLPLQEWVRAASTCTALRSLVLDDITLPDERLTLHGPGGVESFLLWLAKLWRDARSAETVFEVSPSPRVEYAGNDTRQYADFLELTIRQQPWEPAVAMPCPQVAVTIVWACLNEDLLLGLAFEALLASAGHVHALHLELTVDLTMPPLIHLRHLMMSLNEDPERALVSLVQLQSLETLELKCELMESTAADLVLPNSLKHLSLGGTVLRSLLAPAQCNIAMDSLDLLGPIYEGLVFAPYQPDYMWSTHARDQNTILSLRQGSSGFYEAFGEDDLLLCGSNIERLEIHWGYNIVALDSLPQLHWDRLGALYVAAAKISIKLPASLRLVYLQAYELLVLEFQDPEASAAHVQSFSIAARKLAHFENQLRVFEGGLASRHLDFTFEQYNTYWGLVTRRKVHQTLDVSDWEEKCVCKCCSCCF